MLKKLHRFLFPLNYQTSQKTTNSILQKVSAITNQAYKTPEFQRLLGSLDIDRMLDKSVELFVGSSSIPRCKQAAMQVLSMAKERAQTSKKEKVQYYRNYIQLIEALQNKNDKYHQIFLKQLSIMAQKGFPLACHLVAKDIHAASKVNPSKKQADQLIRKAYELFCQAAIKKHYQSLYYIGQILQQGCSDLPINHRQAYECFLISASFDSPKAYFKLAKYHKTGLAGVQKSAQLTFRYTKIAAELGLPEGIHNLACMYLFGDIVKKDRGKALAWFAQGTQRLFRPSLYNQIKLILQGIEEVSLKANPRAAKQLLDKLGDVKNDQVYDQLKELIESKLRQPDFGINQFRDIPK